MNDGGDVGAAQRIARCALRAHDIALPPEGEHQVLGELSAVVHGTAARQLLGLALVGKMRLLRLCRSHRKAGIVLGEVRLEEHVGAGHVADPGQAHRFHQAILQGLKEALGASLGRLNPGNAQRGQGALELCRCLVLQVVLGEDAVPVAVERRRAAMADPLNRPYLPPRSAAAAVALADPSAPSVRWPPSDPPPHRAPGATPPGA